MVIGVLEPHLDGVVVDIAHRKLVAYHVQPEGLELEVGHGTRGILCKRLVYVQVYGRTGLENAAGKMRRQNLICNTESHIILRSEKSVIFILFYCIDMQQLRGFSGTP